MMCGCGDIGARRAEECEEREREEGEQEGEQEEQEIFKRFAVMQRVESDRRWFEFKQIDFEVVTGVDQILPLSLPPAVAPQSGWVERRGGDFCGCCSSRRWCWWCCGGCDNGDRWGRRGSGGRGSGGRGRCGNAVGVALYVFVVVSAGFLIYAMVLVLQDVESEAASGDSDAGSGAAGETFAAGFGVATGTLLDLASGI